MRNGGVGRLATNSAFVIHSLLGTTLNPSALASALVINSDVWTKSYYDTTPIDVITQTNLEFRMIHSEGNSKDNNSQWIFPDEHLDAQAGNYLLTVSQTHELYLVSVFYITQ